MKESMKMELINKYDLIRYGLSKDVANTLMANIGKVLSYVKKPVAHSEWHWKKNDYITLVEPMNHFKVEEVFELATKRLSSTRANCNRELWNKVHDICRMVKQ